MSGAIWLSLDEQDSRRQNIAINQLLEGRNNCTGTVTLSSTGATSTTVTAPTCGPTSAVFLQAQTSGAGSATVAATDVVSGQFIVHHSSSTSTARNFFWAAFG